jgi:molecular chaperone HscB
VVAVKASMSNQGMCHQNPFQCFDFPIDVRIDKTTLEQEYQKRIHQVHPDRFAEGTEFDQRLALQKATQINDAYRLLKSDTLRIRCFLELQGLTFDPTRHTQLPESFLIQQMTWQEQLGQLQAEKDYEGMEELLAQVQKSFSKELDQTLCWIDEGSWKEAQEHWYLLSFLEKLQANLHDTMRHVLDG